MTTTLIPGSWELAGLLCKLLLYFGTASIAGGSFCLWQFTDGRPRSIHHNLSYMMVGAIVGFQAVLFSFLVQVGQISGSGFSGMFDWAMASILLDTSLGQVTFYRLSAFVWAILATLLYLRKLHFSTQPFTQAEYYRLLLVYTVPFLLIVFTFRLSGHVSVLSLFAQIAIGLHVTAFALWIGSLYPLLVLAASEDHEELRQGMKRFGDAALGIVGLLFAAGLFLAFQLFGAWHELVTSPYGLGFLVKLGLVLILLAIAGVNKLVLVPRITEQGGDASLRRSIRIEIVVASLVLIATAYFSTIVGPVDQ